jgi:hypothetical protein
LIMELSIMECPGPSGAPLAAALPAAGRDRCWTGPLLDGAVPDRRTGSCPAVLPYGPRSDPVRPPERVVTATDRARVVVRSSKYPCDMQRIDAVFLTAFSSLWGHV